MTNTLAPETEANGVSDLFDLKLFPIDRIICNENQPRIEPDEDNIAKIGASIRQLQSEGRGVAGTGYLQPLLVRWAPGSINSDGSIKARAKVMIVAGESRYWAGIAEKRTHLPIIITDANSDEAYDDALTENLLRSNLTPVQEGFAFQYYKNKFKESARKLAIRIYKDESKEGYVNSRLEMVNLPEHIRPLIDSRPDSITAARRIKSLKNEIVERELVDYMLNQRGTFVELNKKIRAIKGLGSDDREEKAAERRDRENREKLLERFGPAATTENTVSTRGITLGAPTLAPSSPTPLLPLPENVQSALENHQASGLPNYQDSSAHAEAELTPQDEVFVDEYNPQPTHDLMRQLFEVRESLDKAVRITSQNTGLFPPTFADPIEAIEESLAKIKSALGL